MKNKIDIFDARRIALEALSDYYSDKKSIGYDAGFIRIHEETKNPAIIFGNYHDPKNRKREYFYFSYTYHHGSIDLRPA